MVLETQPQVFNESRRLENRRFPLVGCFHMPKNRAAADCGAYVLNQPQIHRGDHISRTLTCQQGLSPPPAVSHPNRDVLHVEDEVCPCVTNFTGREGAPASADRALTPQVHTPQVSLQIDTWSCIY